MSDYIKREDAIEVFAEHLWEHGLDLDSCRYIAKKRLESVPSADVVENVRLSPITTATKNKPVEYVEVVRCKDCKFWDSDCIWCELWGNTQEYGNGFCSYGERKDDECE